MSWNNETPIKNIPVKKSIEPIKNPIDPVKESNEVQNYPKLMKLVRDAWYNFEMAINWLDSGLLDFTSFDKHDLKDAKMVANRIITELQISIKENLWDLENIENRTKLIKDLKKLYIVTTITSEQIDKIFQFSILDHDWDVNRKDDGDKFIEKWFIALINLLLYINEKNIPAWFEKEIIPTLKNY